MFPKQWVAIFYKKQTEKNEVVARPRQEAVEEVCHGCAEAGHVQVLHEVGEDVFG